MKLLYGVQGTGNGHIARARMMAHHFAKRGIEVQYLFSGRPPEQYFDMAAFGDYWHYVGLTFATEQGRISNIKTLRQLRPLQFIRDLRNIDLSPFDAVITDFEPLTAWAGRLQKKSGNWYRSSIRLWQRGGSRKRRRLTQPPHNALFRTNKVSLRTALE